jgi:hypothetical protein
MPVYGERLDDARTRFGGEQLQPHSPALPIGVDMCGLLIPDVNTFFRLPGNVRE